MVFKRNRSGRITYQRQPFIYLFLAIWFGLITGLSEMLFLGVRKYYFHGMLFLGHDYIWMTPLANLTIFAAMGLIFTILAQQWPSIFSFRVAVFLYTLVGLMNLYFLKPKLHTYAALLLFIGIALQVARYATSHRDAFSSIIRYSLKLGLRGRKRGECQRSSAERDLPCDSEILLPSRRQFLISAGATIGALTLGSKFSDRLAERSALTALPPITRRTGNVLLLVLDTVRAKSLSLHGYSRSTTPELEQLAKNAVVFEWAFSNSPWTLPSHGAMFTGRFPHELKAGWVTPIDSAYPTLAAVLSSFGYETAGFVSNAVYCSYEFGLGRGFSHYEDYPVDFGQMMLSESLARKAIYDWGLNELLGNYNNLGKKSAERINNDFLRWLSHRKDSRPFFAFLNYFDAHEPYLSPKEFQSKFAKKVPWGYSGKKDKLDTLSQAQILELQDAYDGAVAYLDHQIGQLQMELKERGILDNTLVIITSDHGEQFGEHNLMDHGNSLYLPLLHVPLIISFPSKLPGGERIQTPVSLRDLPATILDILGVRNAFAFPGESLTRCWNGDFGPSKLRGGPMLAEINQAWAYPAWYPAMRGEMKSLLLKNMHYIKNMGTGFEELYNLEKDPLEESNLAGTYEARQVLEQFRVSLKSLNTCFHPLRQISSRA